MKNGNNASHDVAIKLARLRQRYVEQLPDKREMLSVFLATAAPESKKLENLLVMAHQLSGSGETFGFPAISRAAKSLEEKIKKDSEAQTSSEIETLIQAIDQAIESCAADSVEQAELSVQDAWSKDLPLLLLVDDDPDMIDLIKSLFQGKAEVMVAYEAQAAFEIINQTKPDFVFLDDQMPGMSGLEFIETIKADETLESIPVIMFTASTSPEKVMRGLVAGAVDYIIKPFDPALLLNKLQKMLERGQKLVLIAEDDPPVLELLTYKFKSSGCKVIAARDGTEALDFMKDQIPDIAILDRMMPGEDGLAVLQKMRSDARLADIPVIFLTAKHSEADILTGLELGAADYIVKPFSAEEVLARCLRLMKTGVKA